MAQEIQFPYSSATGLTTLYALIRNSVNQVWDLVSVAFVTYVEANRDRYDVPLAEDVSGSRHYVANFPTQIAGGVYSLNAYLKAGGTPAGSDAKVGEEPEFHWSGTAVLSLYSIPSTWGASVIGNGRTRDYFLQGGVNKFTQTADGTSLTIYSYDDTTELVTVTETRLSSGVGGLRNGVPTLP